MWVTRTGPANHRRPGSATVKTHHPSADVSKVEHSARGFAVPRRRVATAGRQSLAVACLVLFLGFAWAFAAPSRAAAAEGGVALFDDDGGRALFTAADKLAPGRPVAECVKVGSRTALPGDQVWFAATDVSGPLADHVTVTLESGSGGRFGDCSGFSGTTLWSGRLRALGAASTGNGLDTGWDPSTSETRTFRVTVVMDADLTVQGLTARGDLVWRLYRDVVIDPGGPTDTPTVAPTDTPTTPEPSPTTAAPTTSPAPTTAPPATRTPPPGADTPDVSLDPGNPFVAAVKEVAQRAGQTAYAVVKAPQYPLAALLVAALFLLVQDFIDRRDPKLVAAALHDEDDGEDAFPDVFLPADAPTAARR